MFYNLWWNYINPWLFCFHFFSWFFHLPSCWELSWTFKTAFFFCISSRITFASSGTKNLQPMQFDPWFGKIPWNRKWQPTLVFLPGKFHEQRNLAGYSPWSCKESDTKDHAHARAYAHQKFTCYLLHLFYIKTSFVPSLLIDSNSSRNKNIAPTFQVIEVNRVMHIFLCFFHISLFKMPTNYRDIFLSFLHTTPFHS